MSAKPFQINIPQSILDELQKRLSRTRWPDDVKDSQWDFGTNLSYLKSLVTYWQYEFDWRAQEAQLNKYSQYRADIDGLGIYFIHERGRGPDPVPLIITHGWPDSFYRMHKVIPFLTNPASHGGDPADSFDVIVPSLPGFGFSDRPHERGMTSGKAAGIMKKLMTDVLGYRRFGAAGGDLGSVVSQLMALNYPQSLIGIHVTDIGFYFQNAAAPDLSEPEKEYLSAIQQWFMKEGAFNMIQSTKPQTLAYGLNNSPAGLAAWLVEKFRSWSDCNGDVELRFSKDELLTFVMIYWTTETIGSSMRTYYENSHSTPGLDPGEHIEVPAGVALFKDSPAKLPRKYAERSLRIERWSEMPRGGHFAAWEEPELYAREIMEFFRPLRGSARGP